MSGLGSVEFECALCNRKISIPCLGKPNQDERIEGAIRNGWHHRKNNFYCEECIHTYNRFYRKDEK